MDNGNDPFGLGAWMKSPSTANVFQTAMSQYNPQQYGIADSLATLAELASGLSGDHPEAVGNAMAHDAERRGQRDWMPRMAAQLGMQNASDMALKQQEYDFQQRNYQSALDRARRAYGLPLGSNAAAQMNPYTPGQAVTPGASAPAAAEPQLNGPALVPAPASTSPQAPSQPFQAQTAQPSAPAQPQMQLPSYILESAAAADAKQPGAGANIVAEWMQNNRPSALRHDQLANDLLQAQINNATQGQWELDATLGKMVNKSTGEVRVIPGGGVALTPQMRQKFNDTQTAANNLDKALNDYADLMAKVDGNGYLIRQSKQKDDIALARGNVLMQLKELDNLGALQKGDLEMMNSMLVDPTINGPVDYLQSFGARDGMKSRVLNNITGLKGQVLDRLNTARKSMGLPEIPKGVSAVNPKGETVTSETDPILKEAETALSRGADPQKVKERLMQNGYKFGE